MFQGFDIKSNLTETFYDLYENYFDENLTANQFSEAAILNALRSIISKDAPIDAELISKELFPKIECDIFISHSGKDKRITKSVAGYLHKELGLKCFIDAFVWGNIKTIQQEIDEECRNQDGTWNYNLRNISTGHVHMMLAMSLMEMIDRCECLMLLDTPNSITAKSEIKGETNSPWIFMEMFASKLVRITKPKRSTNLYEAIANADVSRKDASSALNIVHRVDLTHLKKSNMSYICSWVEYCNRNEIFGPESLDALYQEHMINPRFRSQVIIYQ